MLHKAWSSREEMPYCFWRSSVKFQGHTALKIVEFDPTWAFPDCNSSLNSPMAMKCCTKLETAKERWPIVFQGHPSNFKVTRDKTSPILTQIGCFRTIGQSQLSNPSDLPCYLYTICTLKFLCEIRALKILWFMIPLKLLKQKFRNRLICDHPLWTPNLVTQDSHQPCMAKQSSCCDQPEQIFPLMHASQAAWQLCSLGQSIAICIPYLLCHVGQLHTNCISYRWFCFAVDPGKDHSRSCIRCVEWSS